MKNKLNAGTLTAIIIGVVIALSAIGYTFNNLNVKNKDDQSTIVNKQESKSSEPSQSSQMSTESSSMSQMSSKTGIFATYSPDLLTKTAGHKNILFFSATWCPTCQATNKDIQANLNNIDPKLHLLSVDYDTNNSLRVKYGVTMQHTFVEVDGDGNLIKKTSGLPTVAAINAYAFGQ